ncbi:hypothetical protein HanLR1_Chr17g0668391 [Helianthus annuus]|nr:hypothetical protein HanHA89_Chr17g0709821 [Helianthus annuus]KAJ0632729.1 hypothetical protein HanLR1_Chr17g0668391 [Helianthus annuus]
MTWIVLAVLLSLYITVLVVLIHSMMMNKNEQSVTDGCLDNLKTDPKYYPFKFVSEYDQPFVSHV